MKAVILILFLVFTVPCFGATELPEKIATRGYVDIEILHQKELFDSKLGALRELYDMRFKANAEALRLSTADVERRFVRLEDYAPKISSIEQEINNNTGRIIVMETEAGSKALLYTATLGVIFLLAGALMRYWEVGVRRERPNSSNNEPVRPQR